MGFGYLLLGYLISFLIYLTVQALGVGSLALLAGYLLMLYGLATLCKYHNAASGAVKTMREAHEHLSRLFITLRDECLIGLSNRLVRRLVSLYDLSNLLVHYEKVIVFI